jgi:hypothetical protein
MVDDEPDAAITIKIALEETASDLTYLQDTDSDIINDLTDCFVYEPVDTTGLINRLKVILSSD